MRIREVRIKGFLSFKDENVICIPRSTYLVGPSGSGKSSFVYAIRFAVSDEIFSNMSVARRIAILHGDQDNKVQSGYVEVLFEVPRDILPSGKVEVRLRRTLSQEKDEYFLDGNHAEESEVLDILATCGFSRSMPYYAVHNNDISSLMWLDSRGIFNLCEVLSGLQVFKEHLPNLKFSQKTYGKERKQMTSHMEYLDNKLAEMDTILQFKRYDDEKKFLDHNMAIIKRNVAFEKMNQEKDVVKKQFLKMSQVYDLLANENANPFGEPFEEVNLDLVNYETEKAVQNFEEEIKSHLSMSEATEDYKVLCIRKLKKIIDAVKSQVKESRESIVKSKTDLSRLFFKEATPPEGGRVKIEKIFDSVRNSNEEEANILESEISVLNDYLTKQRIHVNDTENLINQKLDEIKGVKFQDDSEDLSREEKKLWEEEDRIIAQIRNYKAKLVKARMIYEEAIPAGIRIVKELWKNNYGEVNGPLLELIECDEKYFSAIEVTAGNSLFHMLYKSEDALNSVEELEELSSDLDGVKFIHYGSVVDHGGNYENIPGTSQLLSCIRYDRKYHEVFCKVFGKTVICDNLLSCNAACAKGFIGIILKGNNQEGDKLNKLLYNERCSALGLWNTIKTLNKLISDEENNLEAVKSQLQEFDKKFNGSFAKHQEKDAKVDSLISELKQLRKDFANASAYSSDIENSITEKSAFITSLRAQITELKNIVVDDPQKTSFDLSSLKSGILALEDSFQAMMKTEDCDLTEESSMLNETESDVTSSVKDVGDCDELSGIMVKHFQRQADFEKRTSNVEALSAQYIKILEDMLKTMKSLIPLNKAYVEVQEVESTSQDLLSSRYLIKSLGRAEIEMLLVKKKSENFNAVNKTILDLRKNITVEKEKLEKYVEELDAGQKAISAALADAGRKRKLLRNFFRDLARFFNVIFAALVTDGIGLLALIDSNEAEHFYAVEVKVSFHGEQWFRYMWQLTVEEKRVVALALILSFQRMNPAPFYLLDDIVDTLDSRFQKAFIDMTVDRNSGDDCASQILLFTKLDQSNVEAAVVRLVKEVV